MRRGRERALPYSRLLLLSMLAGVAGPRPATAQAPPPPDSAPGWHRQAVGQLNLTQVSFDNWSEGGENAVAWQLGLASNFDYRQPNYAWSNSGKLAYGRSKLGDSDFRKTVDEIVLESVLTRKALGWLDAYVSVNARTQFSTGYQFTDSTRTATSAFLDPGYFTQSIGLGYQASEAFKTRFGAALKETVTKLYNVYADDPDTPGIEKNKVEGGVTSVTDLNTKFRDNALLTSKLELFSDLKALNRTDVNWQSTLTVQLAKYVNLNFDVRLLYDSDVSPRRQLKEALALGLTYTFLTDAGK
jgi:Protein of unknown function (DUF3078)